MQQKDKNELEKETVERLQRQVDFHVQLYNTIPCGIIQFTTDLSHKIINANEMTWKIYGYTEEEYWKIAVNPFVFVLKEDQETLRIRVNELVRNGGKISYVRKALGKGGKCCWISVEMERLVNANGIEVIQAMFTDITQAKQMQEQCEKEQLLENRLLRTAICRAYPYIVNLNITKNTYQSFYGSDFLCVEDTKGSYDSFINGLIQKVYPSYRSHFEETFQLERIRKCIQDNEKEIYMEVQQLGKDKEYHWFSFSVIMVDNPYNQDVMAILLVKLLDEQRAQQARQEQLLRDALMAAKEANHAKSDFFSRISHDIRTPLNAILGMSTIGQLKLNNPTQIRNCFEKIDTSSKYLLSLINDILDMSKIKSGKMTLHSQKFDLCEFINHIVTIIYPQTKEKGIEFEIHHIEPLESLYIGDILRLNQILMNLLSNSIKFTKAGGMITLNIQEAKRTNGFAYLEFLISDTGIGMSSDFMERIYQPFEQENNDQARNNIGSGLGLSIVYSLTQLMGGTVHVESKKGEGSCFTILLPFELLEDNETMEQERKTKELLKGIRVLVVDDDILVGEQASIILSDIGADLVMVDSGQSAVKEVEKSLKMHQVFDVAMIDWRMPEMDGVETTKQIRKLVGPETTIIIISAYDWSDIEQEAREAGANYFIPKPMMKTNVYAALNHIDVQQTKGLHKHNTGSLSGIQILLVEDNDLNLEIAVSLLEYYDVSVDTAKNGKIAVEKVKESKPGFYDAIFMDIRMPVMDGLTATKLIRSLSQADAKNVPIIAMTANAFDEDKAIAYKAGISDYLVKPIETKLLFSTLQKIQNKEIGG